MSVQQGIIALEGDSRTRQPAGVRANAFYILGKPVGPAKAGTSNLGNSMLFLLKGRKVRVSGRMRLPCHALQYVIPAQAGIQ